MESAYSVGVGCTIEISILSESPTSTGAGVARPSLLALLAFPRRVSVRGAASVIVARDGARLGTPPDGERLGIAITPASFTTDGARLCCEAAATDGARLGCALGAGAFSPAPSAGHCTCDCAGSSTSVASSPSSGRVSYFAGSANTGVAARLGAVRWLAADGARLGTGRPFSSWKRETCVAAAEGARKLRMLGASRSEPGPPLTEPLCIDPLFTEPCTEPLCTIPTLIVDARLARRLRLCAP